MCRYFILIIVFISFLSGLHANDTQDMEYIYKLYQNKYYQEAVDELHLFIKKYIDSSHYNSALNLLALSYYSLDKYENAETVFIELLTTEYRNNACFYLELIAVKKNQLDKAEKYLQEIDIKDKLRPEAAFRLADKYYDISNFKKAEEIFKQVLAFKTDFYNKALLKLGLIYYKNQEYLKTVAILEEYIKKEKDGTDLALIYYILGVANKEIKDWDHAVTYFKTVEKQFPYSEYLSRSLFNLAKIYNEKNDYENLKTYSRKLINSEYEIQGLILLAEFEYKNNEYSESEKIYKKIIEKNKDSKIIYKLILSLMKQEKYDETLALLGKIKDTEYFSEYYYYTAYILYKKNRFKELIETVTIDGKQIDKSYENDIFLFLAKSALEVRDYDSAGKYYTKLYENTKDKEYLYQLFYIAYKKKEIRESSEFFKEYKKQFPDDTLYKKEMVLSMAELYAEADQYEKAENIYRGYLADNSDDIVLNNLVAVLLKQDKHDEILKYLGDKKNTAEIMYLKGIAYSGKHEYQKAAEIFEDIIKKEKNEFTEKSYLKLCESLLSLKEYDRVVQYSAQYLNEKFQEYIPDILKKKGLAYFRKKDYGNAVITYQELLKYPDDRDYAWFMMGEIYYNQKEYQQARKSYAEVQKFPQSPYKKMSLYWLINIAYQNREYDEALKNSRIFLDTYKKGDYVEEIIYYIGDIYLSRNEYRSAISEYKKLYRTTSDDAMKENLVKSLVKIYMDQKKYNDALTWVKRSADSSFKTLWMGIIYEKQGNYKSAIASYKKLLDDPENGDKANYYLGSYYLKNKKYTEARSYLEKAADFQTSEFKDDSLLKIASSYEEENNYSRAILSLMKIKLVYENSPFQDIVHLKIAEDYEKLDLLEKAVPVYLEFFQKYKTSSYYQQVVERLLVYYINKPDKEEAEKYFNELNQLSPEKARQYKKYF